MYLLPGKCNFTSFLLYSLHQYHVCSQYFASHTHMTYSRQLDRNNHKPSNFIARVGQGGIIHTTYCQYTSRIIVFCSDNSIQCYNGSNYDRVWMEQGLASMSLQEEYEEDEMSRRHNKTDQVDANRRLPKRSPIIIVKDPITSYPMLTNLPGSPGMVHWYDTKSSSVVGTLEVSR